MGRSVISSAAFAAVLGIGFSSSAQAPPTNRTIAKVKGGEVSAEVPVGAAWCKRDVDVTLRVMNNDAFQTDVGLRRRILVLLLGALQGECEKVKVRVEAATISGFAGEAFVYRSVTKRNVTGGWSTMELPVAVVNKAPTAPPPTEEQKVPVREASQASIAACDREASHPDDPSRSSGIAGVTDDAMHAGRALEACEEAVLVEPDNPRLTYQLARAYLMFDRPAEGVELMLDAAEEGHPVAIATLGDFVLYGVLGDSPDPALAKELYQRAADAGFKPAKALADAIETDPSEDKPAQVTGEATFKEPHRLTKLLRGDRLTDTGDEYYYMVTYALGVGGGMRYHCPDLYVPDVDPRPLMTLMEQRIGASVAEKLANESTPEALRQAGLDDGYALAFVKGCSATEVQTILTTLSKTLN